MLNLVARTPKVVAASTDESKGKTQHIYHRRAYVT